MKIQLRVLVSVLRTLLRLPDSLLRVLGMISPGVYALLYVAALLGFAFVFVLATPGGFYHSTSRLEAEMHGLADEILAGIRLALTRPHQSTGSPDILTEGNWRLASNAMKPHSLKTTDGELEFQLSMQFWHIDGENISAAVISPVVRTAIDPPLTIRGHGGFHYVYYLRFLEAGPLVMPIKPSRIAKPVPGSNVPCMVADEELHRKIAAFAKAVRGKPEGVKGHFGRMLYLSAVTITTLGYGDIVPLTDTARFCVGLEATLGVVLIGLFLNSIARRHFRAPQGIGRRVSR